MSMYDLFVFTNGTCNMNCSFCPRRNFLDKDSLTSAERLKIFKNIFTKYPYTVISFTGGEPLKELDFLLPAITHARTLSPNMILSVYTNGSLLTEELVSFFNINKVKLFIAFEDPLIGEKSVLNAINVSKNIALIDLINNLNNVEIVKIIFSATPFSKSLIDLSLLFPKAGFQLTFDCVNTIFCKIDMDYIKDQLDNLKQYKNFKKLRFLLTHTKCEQKCFNMEESGKFKPYPCKRVKGWDGCGELVRRCDSLETFKYFIDIADKFKHEMQSIHLEENNDKNS